MEEKSCRTRDIPCRGEIRGRGIGLGIETDCNSTEIVEKAI